MKNKKPANYVVAIPQELWERMQQIKQNTGVSMIHLAKECIEIGLQVKKI